MRKRGMLLFILPVLALFIMPRSAEGKCCQFQWNEWVACGGDGGYTPYPFVCEGSYPASNFKEYGQCSSYIGSCDDVPRPNGMPCDTNAGCSSGCCRSGVCGNERIFYKDGDEDGKTGSITQGPQCNAPRYNWGVIFHNDCDDEDKDRTPGKTERCDGKDNDCDGIVDEGNLCPKNQICTNGACKDASSPPAGPSCATTWTDIVSCDCTPSACSGCTGTKIQEDSCNPGNVRTASCSLPALGCSGTCQGNTCMPPYVQYDHIECVDGNWNWYDSNNAYVETKKACDYGCSASYLECNSPSICESRSCYANNCDTTGSSGCSSCTRIVSPYNACDLAQPSSCGSEGKCSDQLDNDCDGKTDCADPDCVLQCSPVDPKPLNTAETNAEDNCNDGVDNDGDGKIDCLDTGCASPYSSCFTSSCNPRTYLWEGDRRCAQTKESCGCESCAAVEDIPGTTPYCKEDLTKVYLTNQIGYCDNGAPSYFTETEEHDCMTNERCKSGICTNVIVNPDNSFDFDTDKDMIIDASDIGPLGQDYSKDKDNDGIVDAAFGGPDTFIDRDGDDIPDEQDLGPHGEDYSTDKDNDGIVDAAFGGPDTFIDRDSDGIQDSQDIGPNGEDYSKDRDNDGIIDLLFGGPDDYYCVQTRKEECCDLKSEIDENCDGRINEFCDKDGDGYIDISGDLCEE